MTKKQTITKQKIAATLRESIFTPSKPGPLKVIIDVGDTDYYIKRVIELCTSALDHSDPLQRSFQLTWAISLLAVSKVLTKEEQDG